jgi:hypothetical protein
VITYSPADRYAVLGTSGTGKTFFVVILASLLVPPLATDSDWQCWWLRTKDDPDDLTMLYQWGFRDVKARNSKTARFIFNLTGDREAVFDQAQDISDRAMAQHGVLLIYDEYNHVVKNRVDAGPAVEDVAKRGRGLDVGSIGGVQEPVLVPRFLFSQSIHRAIFGLEHMPDIKIARELNPHYAAGWPERSDVTVPDRHGLWLRSGPLAADDNSWRYHKSAQHWRATVIDQGGLAA